MNLINYNLFDTINTNISSKDLTPMPKWARDEKLYLCEPPSIYKPTKTTTTDKQISKRLLWRSIVNIK